MQPGEKLPCVHSFSLQIRDKLTNKILETNGHIGFGEKVNEQKDQTFEDNKTKNFRKKENTKISTKLSIHGVGYKEKFSVAKNIVFKYIPKQTEAIIVVSLL